MTAKWGFALTLAVAVGASLPFLFGDVAVSVGITAIVLTVIVAQFLVFLVGMAREPNRPVLAFVCYTIVNIGSIIFLFANLYRHLGIKDNAATADASPPFLVALYYSASTWTTLTYGDIVPLPDTRPIAALQALTGYMIMAFLIAVILSVLQARRGP